MPGFAKKPQSDLQESWPVRCNRSAIRRPWRFRLGTIRDDRGCALGSSSPFPDGRDDIGAEHAAKRSTSRKIGGATIPNDVRIFSRTASPRRSSSQSAMSCLPQPPHMVGSKTWPSLVSPRKILRLPPNAQDVSFQPLRGQVAEAVQGLRDVSSAKSESDDTYRGVGNGADTLGELRVKGMQEPRLFAAGHVRMTASADHSVVSHNGPGGLRGRWWNQCLSFDPDSRWLLQSRCQTLDPDSQSAGE